MKLSVCADILYYGEDFFNKIDPIKEAGVDVIEFWSWANKDIEKTKTRLEENGIRVSGFCVGSADAELENLVCTNIMTSGKKEELLTAVQESTEKAKYLGAEFLIITLGDKVEGLSYDEMMKNIIECLEYIKPYLEENNMLLVLEPIHLQERSGYVEPHIKPFFEIVKKLNSPCIKVLYDIYHQTATGDFDIDDMIANIDYIGHIHVADIPGRHEPGTGTINYEAVLKKINASGYTGYVGLECDPVGDLSEIIKNLKSI